MALCSLSADEQGIIFSQLCNALEPRIAVYFGCASRALRASTRALQQQLRVQHAVAAALCHKLGMRSCKALREAKLLRDWRHKRLAATDLAAIGTLGSVLPALEELRLFESSGGAAGPDGVQRLAVGLSAGALPAVTSLTIGGIHMGDAGASELAAALCRGALPRLHTLNLNGNAIGDVGLAALARVLRRLPSLERLLLRRNPFGDKGLAALVAPPPAAGAFYSPGRVLLPRCAQSQSKHGHSKCCAHSHHTYAYAMQARQAHYRRGLCCRSSRCSASARPGSVMPAAPPSS